MRRKWASCSSAGWVSFAYDLLHEARGFQDEVIVHELLHLKVPNHGRLFKALLKAYLGHYDFEAINVSIYVNCYLYCALATTDEMNKMDRFPRSTGHVRDEAKDSDGGLADRRGSRRQQRAPEVWNLGR
jgi:hypothetical protein